MATVVDLSGNSPIYLGTDSTLSKQQLITSNQQTFNWSTAVAAPPIAKSISVNNAVPMSATLLWITKLTVAGVDATKFINMRFIVGHSIYIQEIDKANNFMQFNVTSATPTDLGTYFSVAVTGVAVGGSIVNSRNVIVIGY